MCYIFGGNIVKIDSKDDLEQLLDCVIDMYLGIVGATEDEIVEAFRDLGFDVEKYNEEDGE